MERKYVGNKVYIIYKFKNIFNYFQTKNKTQNFGNLVYD